MDENQLVRNLQQGDTKALEQLMERYTPYVNTVVYHILGQSMGKEDVEETISDVFVILWRNAGKVKPGKLRPYLASIARNLSLKKLRSAGLTLALEEDVLPPDIHTPDSIAEAKEERVLVRRTVDEMGPPDREIFLRHYFYCQGVETIAREMGMNPGTVKTRLRRGREKLFRILSKEV